ncbi:MAG: hypothetical protein OEM82_13640, partial [Acidobacteriota bacterium]|nr:hypothetical protein [Acidobacteriota bacterium]
MKNRTIAVISIMLCVSFSALAQTSEELKEKKPPRLIVTDPLGSAPDPSPTPRKVVIITSAPEPGEESTGTPSQPSAVSLADLRTRSLRFAALQKRIAEAKRQMRVKPLRISMSDESQTTEIVRIAFFDWDTEDVDYAVISKVAFLDNLSEVMTRSEGGKWLRIKTIRGNGVNTPVIITDSRNRTH